MIDIIIYNNVINRRLNKNPWLGVRGRKSEVGGQKSGRVGWADIGFKIMILGRIEGGRRTRRTSTTDNTPKIFILKPISDLIFDSGYRAAQNLDEFIYLFFGNDKWGGEKDMIAVDAVDSAFTRIGN